MPTRRMSLASGGSPTLGAELEVCAAAGVASAAIRAADSENQRKQIVMAISQAVRFFEASISALA